MSRVSGLTERVRLMILRGELPAGGRVLEVHLCETFDVRRTLVREALRRLEADGLLVANSDGGMRVVALDREALAETLQVRAALEALGAELVAGRVRAGLVGADELARLDALADRAQLAADGDDPLQALLADRDLHRALDALAHNRLAQATLRKVWDTLVVATLHAVARPQRAAEGHDHRELLAAVAAGDGERAAALARRHVLALLD